MKKAVCGSSSSGDGQEKKRKRQATTSRTGGYQQQEQLTFVSGEKVMVSWRNNWYDASILKVKSKGRYMVTFHGYSKKWDKVITQDRIRKGKSSSSSRINGEKGTHGMPLDCAAWRIAW